MAAARGLCVSHRSELSLIADSARETEGLVTQRPHWTTEGTEAGKVWCLLPWGLVGQDQPPDLPAPGGHPPFWLVPCALGDLQGTPLELQIERSPLFSPRDLPLTAYYLPLLGSPSCVRSRGLGCGVGRMAGALWSRARARPAPCAVCSLLRRGWGLWGVGWGVGAFPLTLRGVSASALHETTPIVTVTWNNVC